MRNREVVVPTASGGSVLVAHTRGEYGETLDVDNAQVLHRIRGKQWAVGHAVKDLEPVAYAALGWLALHKEGSR